MQKTRILIVEDETAIAKMIAMNLRVANYDAVIYEDGAEAAKGLEQDHAYDLALLDVMVPGMDGFTLLPIVREYGIPVIFLTAKDDLASKIQGLKGGAEDYIVKPFEVLELLVRIEKVLARTKPEEHTLSVLNLEIDFEQHTVRQDGKEVSLKPMEFELLAVLARNKNRAISRENLLRMVWGVEYMGETRTVDVQVRIQKTAKAIAKLDAFASLALVAEQNNYVRPKMNDKGLIDIKDGRHPVVEKMISNDMFICNDTYLNDKKERISIITGPNMAGKSTYMRQTALINYILKFPKTLQFLKKKPLKISM